MVSSRGCVPGLISQGPITYFDNPESGNSTEKTRDKCCNMCVRVTLVKYTHTS